jgi:hypothetical protein
LESQAIRGIDGDKPRQRHIFHHPDPGSDMCDIRGFGAMPVRRVPALPWAILPVVYVVLPLQRPWFL